MELATSFGPDQSSSLTLAAISHVFTLKYVAEKLGEDEQWLWDLQISMDLESILRRSLFRQYRSGADMTGSGLRLLTGSDRDLQDS